MNSELEAIMRRRRRKADGEPSSPEPRNSRKKDSPRSRGETVDQASVPPPPLESDVTPPPPSSLALRRNHERVMAMRRQVRLRLEQQQQLRHDDDDAPTEDSPRTAADRRALDRTRTSRSTRNSENLTDDHYPSYQASPILDADARHGITRSDVDDEYSSSDEEEDIGVEESPNTPEVPPLQQDTLGFANFEADFGSLNLGENQSLGFFPPEFQIPEYEPPPAFDVTAFEPPEPIDYTPLSNPPSRPTPQVLCKEHRVYSDATYFCPPVINPLTGNIIVCCAKGHDIVLREIDPLHSSEVASTPILNLDVQRKIASTYGLSACGVSKVLCIAAGLHKPEGQTRVRVAALVEFKTLTSTGQSQLQTVLATWQWGYGTNRPNAFQALLSPPNSASFTYDAQNLQLADGLVFLSGNAKNQAPCVFCVKPNVKTVWQGNMLAGSGRVTSMKVTLHPHRKFKYLAVALSSGTISIWTYEGAVDRKAEEATKTLVPLCRLEGAQVIANLREAIIGDSKIEGAQNAGHCISLEWITLEPSSSSLLLLAAAFTNGVAIFHVSLPLLTATPDDPTTARPLPESTTSTTLAQTVLLHPVAAARWSQLYQDISISWMTLGPHIAPSLAIRLEQDSSAHIAIAVWDMEASNNDLQTFRIIYDKVMPTTTEKCVGGLLGPSSDGSFLSYSMNSIVMHTPTLSSDASYFNSLKRSVTSGVPGLDAAGCVSLPDTISDKEGVLYIFTVNQCQRVLNPKLPSLVVNSHRLDWKPPVQRHWLCRAAIGDTKDAQEPSVEVQNGAQFGDDETVTGGSHTNVICELNCGSGVMPCRIVRCKGSSLCAVLFQLALCSSDDITEDPVSYSIVDTTTAKVVNSGDCRDFLFLPKTKEGLERVLVLSQDGSSIRMLYRAPESDEIFWNEGSPMRALLGTQLDDDFIECRRLLLLSSESKLGLMIIGTRFGDGRSCFIVGEFACLNDDDGDGWNSIIPNAKMSSTMWLNESEHIISAVELPRYQDGRRLVAVASNRRVMLLSSTLELSAECTVELSGGSLAPVGSHSVAFCSADCKVRYLCCLDGKFSQGLIATLPTPNLGRATRQLMALRPERLLYSHIHSGVRLVEPGKNPDEFVIHAPVTRPVLVLEPLVANALCETDDPGESTELLRVVIERFGRKVAPFPHGDDEGIGATGSGLTPRVLEMLSAYGLKHAASWLLTGSSRFERAANSKILPPWMPMPLKADAALNSDAYLHIIANGDQYFSDYVKAPDQNMASTLPRPSDPSAAFCHEFARRSMQNGDVAGALKLLDLAGTESSDSALLHLALSLQLQSAPDVKKVLKALCGFGDDGNARSTSYSSTTSSLAALVVDLKSRQVKGKIPQENGEYEQMSDEFCRRWMRQLAPSVQRGHKAQRARHRLIGDEAIRNASRGQGETRYPDSRWNTPCNESKHIWNEGPLKDKENLLLLDRIEDWLGRKRPAILGREGAAAALERGEKTLADILNKAYDYDDDSFGGQSDAGSANLKDGWIDGIGEGRTDDDNLVEYYRMSEGADEDSNWRTEGLVGLTKFQNKALLVGQSHKITLQATTSSVDEGEPGKVKLLYDLVFVEGKHSEGPSGLLIEIPRGSSLDVGILHGPTHEMRKRCSIEFWYHLPAVESIADEIVLVRRSVSSAGEDVSKLCVTADRDNVLWELVSLRSGELEFRSSGGTTLLSTSEANSEFETKATQAVMGDFGDDLEEVSGDEGLVSWERSDGGGGWNHVCLVFSSRRHRNLTDCTVKLYMKGVNVASTVASIVPPGLEDGDINDVGIIDEAMHKTVLAFGLNAVANFRMTELRFWSCERSEDDIKMMMYEYLRAAETKKKFKVKIRSKRGTSLKADAPRRGNLLAPPKGDKGLRLSQSEKGAKGLLPPPRARGSMNIENSSSYDGRGFQPSFEKLKKPKREREDEPTRERDGHFDSSQASSGTAGMARVPFGRDETFLAEIRRGSPRRSEKQPDGPSRERNTIAQKHQGTSVDSIDSRGSSTITAELWSVAVPLSKQVRSSAAAALVRGPPATRHFGGNRGGLSYDIPMDRNEFKRFGVGSIAICGAEKTVVYASDQNPPGKTYPIGASGAIISDEMDNDGSEYLCCFLAKDKRMVVFELSTKTVVVELQMTTKLNFWRYLPPQAHGHTLVFMLVTPVGGFHWMPLDESPRPRQVWKRGPELQGKKIVTYEEGGSNGLLGPDARSTISLLLVSTASTGTPLEAWIMPVCGDSNGLCVSSDVLGAALCRPFNIVDDAFFPLLVTANRLNDTDIIIEVEPLTENMSTGEIEVADVVTCAVIDQRLVRGSEYSPPTLAMGGWPEVLCCCFDNVLVACIRRKGLVAVYELRYGDLLLLRQDYLGHYVVDAALRPGSGEDEIEIVVLLSDVENPRDGRVVSINVITGNHVPA